MGFFQVHPDTGLQMRGRALSVRHTTKVPSRLSLVFVFSQYDKESIGEMEEHDVGRLKTIFSNPYEALCAGHAGPQTWLGPGTENEEKGVVSLLIWGQKKL